MEVLKISSKSNPNSVAGAIAGLVKETNKAEMQAIGAGAVSYTHLDVYKRQPHEGSVLKLFYFHLLNYVKM